jgi:hypothetical protein
MTSSTHCCTNAFKARKLAINTTHTGRNEMKNVRVVSDVFGIKAAIPRPPARVCHVCIPGIGHVDLDLVQTGDLAPSDDPVIPRRNIAK